MPLLLRKLTAVSFCYDKHGNTTITVQKYRLSPLCLVIQKCWELRAYQQLPETTSDYVFGNKSCFCFHRIFGCIWTLEFATPLLATTWKVNPLARRKETKHDTKENDEQYDMWSRLVLVQAVKLRSSQQMNACSQTLSSKPNRSYEKLANACLGAWLCRTARGFAMLLRWWHRYDNRLTSMGRLEIVIYALLIETISMLSQVSACSPAVPTESYRKILKTTER